MGTQLEQGGNSSAFVCKIRPSIENTELISKKWQFYCEKVHFVVRRLDDQ